MTRRPEVIVALDMSDSGEAARFASASLAGEPRLRWFKVGLELFTVSGPAIVASLKNLGAKVFLDLKFYDIPNTAASAAKAAARLGVDMLTIHCQGGARMLSAVMDAISGFSGRPLVMGVTALTSFGPGEMPGINASPGAFGLELAALAAERGLDGVICSGHESRAIKNQCPDLLCACPGARPKGTGADDQRRVMTPAAAIANGADFLVIGRPITRAADPVAAARDIIDESVAAHEALMIKER